MLRLFVASILPVLAAGLIDVEIYYSPYESHSAAWVGTFMPELIGANLEGVTLTLYPYVLENGQMPDPSRCQREGAPCHYLAAPLCGLQQMIMPAPPMDIKPGVDFALCDLMHANAWAPAEITHRKSDVEQCALSSGLDYLTLQQCMVNPMPSGAYLAQVQNVWSRIPNGQARLPYVFVDGQFVDTTAQTDLLKVICGKYYTEPAACAITGQYEVGQRFLGPAPPAVARSSGGGASDWATTILAILVVGGIAAVAGITVMRRMYGPRAVPIFGDETRTLVVGLPMQGEQVVV